MTAKATRAKKPQAAKISRPAVPLKADRFADAPSMDEPSLRDMLQDPIMLRLMSSDGISPHQLMSLVAAARSRMSETP